MRQTSWLRYFTLTNVARIKKWSWLYYSILCFHRGMSPLHAPNPLMCQQRLPVLEVSLVCRGSPVEKVCRSVCNSERGTERACWWPLTCSTMQERCGFIWARREHDYRSIRPDGSWRTSQQVELRYHYVYLIVKAKHISCLSRVAQSQHQWHVRLWDWQHVEL